MTNSQITNIADSFDLIGDIIDVSEVFGYGTPEAVDADDFVTRQISSVHFKFTNIIELEEVDFEHKAQQPLVRADYSRHRRQRHVEKQVRRRLD